jgi:hypothetical protein
MCHTSATLSQSALEAGGDWRCVRCGQHWDAARLAAVAAYAAWTVDHDRVGRERRRSLDGQDRARCPMGLFTIDDSVIRHRNDMIRHIRDMVFAARV